MQHITDITLKELLNHKNESIRRNAKGILNQLMKEEIQSIEQEEK